MKANKREGTMITLHRLGHTDEPFQLNPDLIVTVESTPDTVVTLATTAKVVVAESPDEVAAAVRTWRVGVLSEAMRNRRPEHDPSPVHTLGKRPERVEGSRLPADERGR
jgi:flagellar protein FlbD